MTQSRKRPGVQRNRNRGFSLLELLIVIVVTLIAAAFAAPSYITISRNLRIAGDGRDINGAINAAKLQAASGFTRSRAYADLSKNTFHTEVWNKTGNGGAGCWQTVGDPAHACTAQSSPVQVLSQNVLFGTDHVATPPPNTQALASFGQAPQCQNTTGGTGTINNTACIVFNSRGVPVVPGYGAGVAAPTGNDAFYITDGNTVFGMTTNASGYSQVWSTQGNSTVGSWTHR
jgi:prepilin-type N-terminal cleavage/methylation domain-containing protein